MTLIRLAAWGTPITLPCPTSFNENGHQSCTTWPLQEYTLILN